MGWCSGTQIFDDVAGQILDKDEIDVKEVLTSLIQSLQYMDWDCESDSAYWEHPVVREIFMELEPEWFEDDE